MVDRKAKPKALQIREDEHGDQQYLIHPGDHDLFVRTGRQIIDACRLGIGIEVWLDELDAMTAQVKQWADERSQSIRSCYCAPQGPRIALYFCPTTSQFDFELAHGLAELSLELRRVYKIGMIDVQQIPWDEAARFLCPESARLIYGERLQGAPDSVETQ